jgi:DHA1 family multidrug resistance protein-like MFS transporter
MGKNNICRLQHYHQTRQWIVSMQAQKLYTSSVVILAFSAMVENLAYALPMPYFPNYVQALGASITYIGLFTAAFTAANAAFSQRLGTLSDRIGRKKLIEFGLMIDIFLGILTGLIWNWAPLLIIRILNGVATAAVAAPSEASLVDQVPETKRGEALGFYLTMAMIGFNLGPVFGGLFQSFFNSVGFSLEWSYRLPFFVDSLLAFVAFILVWKGVKETRGKSFTNPKKIAYDLNEDDLLSKKVKFSLRILYFAQLTIGFAVGLIIPITVLYLGDIFRATPIQIGIILSASGFFGLIFNLYAGKLSDKIGRKIIIAIGNLPARLSTLIFPFAPNLLSAAGIYLFEAFGHNIAMPASRALVADLVPEKIRGKLFGRMFAFFSLGAIIGPILSTWIYDVFRFSTIEIPLLGLDLLGAGIPYIISAVVGLISLLILLAFVEEPKKPKRNQQRVG